MGVRRPETGEHYVTRGPLAKDSIVYAASLSKQITALCLALLVRRGIVDADSCLADWVPGLPGWAAAVRLRHLVHHTAGLPSDALVESRAAGSIDRPTERAQPGTAHSTGSINRPTERAQPAAAHSTGSIDRSTEGLLAALASCREPVAVPGTEFAYSNIGYVCLAEAIQQATRRPLADFARGQVFEPLGMYKTCFWSGPEPHPPHALPCIPARPAPLSLGDGGVWSTASDLLRWNEALNRDLLGVSRLVQTPGKLNDGTILDYAWGVGVRSHDGYRVYRHGGGWQTLRAMLTRIPALGLGTVFFAVADGTERRVPLTESLLNLMSMT